MAKKRGRRPNASSLDQLASELRALDARRASVVRQLRQATERLLAGENPFPWGNKKAGRKQAPKPPAKRRRKMSAAARAAISKAQKARPQGNAAQAPSNHTWRARDTRARWFTIDGLCSCSSRI